MTGCMRRNRTNDLRVVNPMNAGLLQTSKPSSLEIQTHRNVDPLLQKQVVKLGGAQVIEKIGGRGGTRTRGPLLAKQIGRKSKCVFWCCLRVFGRLLIRTMIPS
jgi:hypothetical protein